MNVIFQVMVSLFVFSGYLVDTVKSCEIGSHHDALVYTAGAIKHLSSNNPTTQKELVSLEGIEGLGQILDAISKDVSLWMLCFILL